MCASSWLRDFGYPGRHKAAANGSSPRGFLCAIYVAFEVYRRYRIILAWNILGDSTPSRTLPMSKKVI